MVTLDKLDNRTLAALRVKELIAAMYVALGGEDNAAAVAPNANVVPAHLLLV
jgi:hypothetical protein